MCVTCSDGIMEQFTDSNIFVDALLTAILIWILIHPDFRSYITQKVGDLAVTTLKKWATDFTLPDISRTLARTWFGPISYGVRSIRANFDIPSLELVRSGSSITFSISGASAVVRGNWSYRFLLIQDSGTFYLYFRDIEASLTVHAGFNRWWRFTLSTSEADCDVNVGKVTIELLRRSNWFYSLVKKIIAGQIQESANEEICREIVKHAKQYLEQVSNKCKVLFDAAVFTCILLYILVIHEITLCLNGLFYMSLKWCCSYCNN